MKRAFTFLILFILSAGGFAEQPKEVIISGQSAPVDVQLMPDTPITLDPGTTIFAAPAGTTAARVRPFSIRSSFGGTHLVNRDSILKFVNVTVEFASILGPQDWLSCSVFVELQFPPPNDNDIITLAFIQVLPKVVQRFDEVGIGADFPTSYQFMTGDILVPTGSILTARSGTDTNATCGATAYGILFEQD